MKEVGTRFCSYFFSAPLKRYNATMACKFGFLLFSYTLEQKKMVFDKILVSSRGFFAIEYAYTYKIQKMGKEKIKKNKI